MVREAAPASGKGRGSGRFVSGLVEALPLWLGVVPFGFVYSAVGRRAGLSGWELQLMSLLVFAGGAQFTVVRLVSQGAPRSLLVIAATLINLRHVLYGLALAPHLRAVRHGLRAAAAFFIVDESYGLGMRAYLEGRGAPPTSSERGPRSIWPGTWGPRWEPGSPRPSRIPGTSGWT